MYPCLYDVHSLVEIKFNQTSITPLNTIIVIIIIKSKRYPLQNNSSKNAKCILPPFKIRSVCWTCAFFSSYSDIVVVALCPLKSHQLCMSEQQSHETILSSTHKNVFLSFIWLKISILWRLSLFSSSYTHTRFDFSCSVGLGSLLFEEKSSQCICFFSCDFLFQRVDGQRRKTPLKLNLT